MPRNKLKYYFTSKAIAEAARDEWRFVGAKATVKKLSSKSYCVEVYG